MSSAAGGSKWLKLVLGNRLAEQAAEQERPCPRGDYVSAFISKLQQDFMPRHSDHSQAMQTKLQICACLAHAKAGVKRLEAVLLQ